MRRAFRALSAVIVFLAFTCVNLRAHAQTSGQGARVITVSRISGAIDENKLVKLSGNTPRQARPKFDRGVAPSNLKMLRMMLVLKRSPEQESALQRLISAQHDLKSPQYHQWLTPQEFGAQFGAAQEDVSQILGWLQGHGFKVGGVSNGRLTIEFSGTHLQVQQAFHTKLHRYQVDGELHLSNSSDPEIPAALAPVIVGVNSLNDFRKKPTSHVIRKLPGLPSSTDATANNTSGSMHTVAPGDFWTIYNATPAIQAGTTGKGITIGIAGRSDISESDVSYFRTTYIGGTAYRGTFEQIVNGPDPGVVAGDDLENTLDVEWASALAPDATVKLVVSQSGSADGVDLSAQYLVDSNLADVISVSYGLCESFLGQTGNQFLSSLWAQAATQGMTVAVSTGDNGSAGCDGAGSTGNDSSPNAARYGLQVNGLASTAYNVAVGGNQYFDEASSWNLSNGSSPLFGTSALGYIPETVWNESCSPDRCGGGANLWAASGGASSCATSVLPYYDVTGCSGGWPKPEWQGNVFGIPNDGVRDLPDVSFTAAGHDGYLVSFEGSLYTVGGTSCSTPAFAGVMALVNQRTGGRQGQPNYTLYKLARNLYGDSADSNSANLAACNASARAGSGNSCTFYDVTEGSNAVPCAGGTANCSATTPGNYGTLNGYSATAGYDLATGIGSINITNLLQAWDALIPHGTTPSTTILQVNPTTGLAHGSPVSIAVSVAPAGGGGTPTGTVTIVANNNVIATLALSGGTYSGSIATLPGGQYSVVARYSGDARYLTSTSSGVNVSIGKESSITTVSVTARDARTGASITTNSIPYGSNTLLHGSVTAVSGQGTPTGTLAFSTGFAAELNTGGETGYGSVTFAPGTYSVSGSYAGDVSFSASQSASSGAFTVVKGSTGVSLSSGTANLGTIPVAATVSTNSYGTSPSGKTAFFINGTRVGTVDASAATDGPSLSSASATFAITTAMLGEGMNSITAQYEGDVSYNSSAVSLALVLVGKKATLTNPAMPVVPVLAQVFKPGAAIPVYGTVYGSFQTLRVEWALGINPTSGWSSSNVNVIGSLLAPIVEKLVANWTPTGITSAGYYTIRLSVDDGNITSTSTGLVYLEPDLASNSWPKVVVGAPSSSYSGLVPALQADGSVRFALNTFQNGDVPSRLRTFTPDGVSQSVFDLPWGSWYQPAAGNLDLLSGDEILVGDRRSLYVFHPDGSSYTLSPTVPGMDLFFAYQQIVLDDVDGDSLLETIAMGDGIDGTGNFSTGYVFAWRNNGQLLNARFPIAVKDQNPYVSGFTAPRMLVGDIDGDGAKEFLVIEGTTSSTFTPRLFGTDGSPRTWGATTFNSYPVQTLLADLDHNGQLETVFITYDRYLHVLQPNGSERPGWPRQLRYSGWGASIAVADLNRDGHEEIVASEVDISVFNADGTPFSSAWPKLVQWGGFGSAVLADVNGDGYPDIVTSFSKLVLDPSYPTYNTSQLIAMDRNGTVVKSWNLPGANGEQPGSQVYATVGDFDNDGRTDIAVSYDTFPLGSGSITQSVAIVYTTGYSFRAAANDWPMLNQNSRNTAVLRRVSGSAITMSSSANHSLPRGSILLTMSVAPLPGGAGIPTGVVNLLDGALNIGSCALSSGACSISPVLATGTHSLVAGYVGDASFASSMSTALIYTIGQLLPTVAQPSFNPAAGTYSSAQSVAISDTTPGATTYYTLDGSTPTTSSSKYTTPLSISQTTTIKTIAMAGGYNNSAVASATYTIVPPDGSLLFVPITPCRVADTRSVTDPFGGPAIAGGSTRDFVIPNSACGIPATAAAYSLNVTAVPHGGLKFLTVWPSGQAKPLVSTLNSDDGRVKANAAIVPAGINGAISVFATDTTDLVLDINGYFVPAPNASALAFYPLTPCRIADTRNLNGPLGGPYLVGQQTRAFPIQSSSCNVPPGAQAYSLNFTAVPREKLGWLATWPAGQTWTGVSTLNLPETKVPTANAAIVPAGTNGAIDLMTYVDMDAVIDINGYYAPLAPGGLSLYSVNPCRVLDTRNTTQAFNGTLPVNVAGSGCGVPASALAFVLNSTVVLQPTKLLAFLTLWPNGQTKPLVSTLNAQDGTVTSNMAIVPTTDGWMNAFSSDATDLVMDISGYFAAAVSSGGASPSSLVSMEGSNTADGSASTTSLGGNFVYGANGITGTAGPDSTGTSGVSSQDASDASSADVKFRYGNNSYGACKLSQGATLQLQETSTGVVVASTPFPAQSGTRYTLKASVVGNQATCEVVGHPDVSITGTLSEAP